MNSLMRYVYAAIILQLIQVHAAPGPGEEGVPLVPLPQHRVKRAGGAITAAIIGATAASITAGTAGDASFGRGDKGGCTWFGTSPFCDGECPDHHGYTEEVQDSTRASAGYWALSTLYLLNPWVAAGVAGTALSQDTVDKPRPYGAACWTGSKSLCCRSISGANVWNGLWENHLTNEKLRCDAYKRDTDPYNGNRKLKCGLHLKCSSDKHKSGNEDYVWLFNVIGRGCNVIEAVSSNCKGTHSHDVIKFNAHKDCGGYFTGANLYKVH